MKKANRSHLLAILLLCFTVFGPLWPSSVVAQEDGIELEGEDFELDDIELEEESGGDSEEVAEDDFNSEEDEFSDEDFEADDEELAEDEFEADEFEEDEETNVAEEQLAEEEAEEQAQSDEVELEPLDEKLSQDMEEEMVVQEPEPEPVAPEAPMMTEAATDEPDLSLEAKLYNIYLNYHSKKTPESQWQTLVGERKSETYQVQPGDTLWGISQTIFGDGNYWPKIWSLNGRILNPHLISPGNSIQFLLGSEEEAPAFTVTEVSEQDGDEQDERTEEQTVTDQEIELEIDIPEPSIASRPVVMKLPPSLPVWQDASRGGDYDDLGIDYKKRPILDLKDEIPLSYYIAESDPESEGRVSEVESNGVVASLYQYVYVKVKKGQAKPGDIYLAIRNMGPPRKANDIVAGVLGYSYQVQGEVKLLDSVGSRVADNRHDLFRAMVTRILNPITKGAMLVRDRVEMVDISNEGEPSDVVAQVVGGQRDDRRGMFGPESIAYLNRGSKHGLVEGQILSIRSNLRIRNRETIVAENIRAIGRLKVAKVTPTLATAVVIKSWDDILPGDLTGPATAAISPGDSDESEMVEPVLDSDAEVEFLEEADSDPELESDDGLENDSAESSEDADDFDFDDSEEDFEETM